MPTTTNFGWTYPSSSGYVKNGASDMQTIAQGVDTTLFTALGGNYPGLRLIKKQTIGTTVSTVSVTSVFSATYENYLILISGGVASAATVISTTMTGTATGYYGNYISGTYGGTTVTNASDNNAARWLYTGYGSTDSLNAEFSLVSPFATKQTFIRGSYVSAVGGGSGPYLGFLNNTTSYTGFTITPNTGGVTFTGGNVYVYGYGIS